MEVACRVVAGRMPSPPKTSEAGPAYRILNRQVSIGSVKCVDCSYNLSNIRWESGKGLKVSTKTLVLNRDVLRALQALCEY